MSWGRFFRAGRNRGKQNQGLHTGRASWSGGVGSRIGEEGRGGVGGSPRG